MFQRIAGEIRAGGRPTALALLLALAAWPLVAVTLGAVYPRYAGVGPERPASVVGQWSAAAGAVFLSALVAAPIGASMSRRLGALLGGPFTFVAAVPVAMISVMLPPQLLGQEVGVACESSIAPGFASSPCDPALTSVADAVRHVPLFWLAPFVEPGPVLVLAAGILIWALIGTHARWWPGLPVPSARIANPERERPI
jgi:hypothetical protein